MSLASIPVRNKIIGKKIIPNVPYKLTTAIETATSSLSFVTEGESAAIAEEPQIAVPNPISQPEEPGQLNFFAKNTVRMRTVNRTTATAIKLPLPNFAILEKLIAKAKK